MNPSPTQSLTGVWSFWIAALLVAVGAVLPYSLGGLSSRMGGVILPLAAAAGCLFACGRFAKQGRLTVSILYFVAGMAIVYALLAMFALFISLSAIGSCPAAPSPCPDGLPRALSVGELNGMSAATGFGVAGLVVGFFGLAMAYRSKTTIVAATPADTSIPTPRPPADVEPAPELPAPEELPELPAHESSSAST